MLELDFEGEVGKTERKEKSRFISSCFQVSKAKKRIPFIFSLAVALTTYWYVCLHSQFFSLVLGVQLFLDILIVSQIQYILIYTEIIQFSSVQSLKSCPTLCDPMNRSTPGLPVHHQLPEFTQTHVHPVGDAIQTSSPSPPALNLSQHQGLFK